MRFALAQLTGGFDIASSLSPIQEAERRCRFRRAPFAAIFARQHFDGRFICAGEGNTLFQRLIMPARRQVDRLRGFFLDTARAPCKTSPFPCGDARLTIMLTGHSSRDFPYPSAYATVGDAGFLAASRFMPLSFRRNSEWQSVRAARARLRRLSRTCSGATRQRRSAARPFDGFTARGFLSLRRFSCHQLMPLYHFLHLHARCPIVTALTASYFTLIAAEFHFSIFAEFHLRSAYIAVNTTSVISIIIFILRFDFSTFSAADIGTRMVFLRPRNAFQRAPRLRFLLFILIISEVVIKCEAGKA